MDLTMSEMLAVALVLIGTVVLTLFLLMICQFKRNNLCEWH